MQNLHKKFDKNSTHKMLEIREKLYYNENALIKKAKKQIQRSVLNVKTKRNL